MFRNMNQVFNENNVTDIRQAFAGRLTVDFATAARILEMDAKTLRRHAKSGTITYVDLGHGGERRRRRFTYEDLVAFVASRRRRDAPVPRSDRYTRTAAGGEEESFLACVERRKRERQAAARGRGKEAAGATERSVRNERVSA
jgi:hypothetical protein